MDHQEPQQWPPQSESFEPFGTIPEEDFSKFLDFDNLDFNFDGSNGGVFAQGGIQDNNLENNEDAAHCYASSTQYENFSATFAGSAGFEGAETLGNTRSGGVDCRDYAQFPTYDPARQWQAYQQMHPHMSVPPTPNSSGMHPTQYAQQIGQQTRYGEQGPAFSQLTPLTSPHFVDSTSSAPASGYISAQSRALSPLNSPAMYPQSEQAYGSSSVQSLTAPSSMTGSPRRMDLDMDGNESLNDGPPRKSRRKESVSRVSKPPAASTRRKKAAAASKTDHKSASLAQRTTGEHSASSSTSQSQPSSASPQPPNRTMRPPPKPASAKSTPAITAQGSHSQVQSPATPASLMRLSSQQGYQGSATDQGSAGSLTMTPSTEGLGQSMEELSLPEAAAASATTSINATPRMTASVPPSGRATPALLPRIPSSSTPTLKSPPNAPLTNTSKNPNGRGGSRKRNSTSSNLISPAIRPRISPSIRPLNSETSQSTTTNANDETHALLLASKSNYQNLLEGNTLPGVNYPSELSHNLTNKRTSHKIAEQGRRNRINTALQEMQALLPGSPALDAISPTSGDKEMNDATGERPSAEKAKGRGSGGDAGSKTPVTPTATAAQTSNSKAATVEMAIDYIKTLSSKLADKDGEIERLRVEAETLRKRLGGGSAGAGSVVEEKEAESEERSPVKTAAVAGASSATSGRERVLRVDTREAAKAATKMGK